MIQEYHFGSITIDGKTYHHDVEVISSGEVLKWWRKESHVIDVQDIKRAIEQNPDTIIIGTGESGVAEVTETAKKEIQSKGIELIIEITGEAVKSFNLLLKKSEEAKNKKKIIGLFHLTC